jgi:MarR family transcriptional regulator, 2-MHQ and catechol-resistance regulon repressor
MLIKDETPLNILFSIVRTWEVVERYLDLELQSQDSSLIRFAVMNTLYRHGGQLTPTELAHETFRSDNSITSVIKTLEAGGFIERIRSDSDGRSTNVVITDKGWEKTNNMTPRAQEFSRDMLQCLNKEEIEILLPILRKLRKSLLDKIDIREKS